MIKCATCKQEVDYLNEADECEDCAEIAFQAEVAYWRPLYEGEKQAGLLEPAWCGWCGGSCNCDQKARERVLDEGDGE